MWVASEAAPNKIADSETSPTTDWPGYEKGSMDGEPIYRDPMLNRPAPEFYVVNIDARSAR